MPNGYLQSRLDIGVGVAHCGNFARDVPADDLSTKTLNGAILRDPGERMRVN